MANLYNKRSRRFGTGRKFRSLVLLPVMMLAAALLASGCAGDNDNGNGNGNRGTKAQSYGNDGYLGLSNSNPHLLTRSGTQLNYRSDAGLATQQLKTLKGIQQMSLSFQGPHLYVTIRPKPGVDEMQLRHRAIGLLRYNMPRYTIHVNTVK
ncbi:hypothetical protein [Paenibacillus xanthanilyticus]|uniref:Uncharacterized protein n=1 Tax=Paenibacillus xanthanilyticus TaxID=1783531 RepID=A0ABV8JXB3_9BACL